MNRKYNIFEEDTGKFVNTEVLGDIEARYRSSHGYVLKEVQ